MRIRAVDLFLLDLPLTEPFVAGHGRTEARTIAMIEVTTDAGIGWGECSALPAATYTAESAAGSFRALAEDLAPRLFKREVDHGSVAAMLGERAADRPMAVAGLQMAVLDAELRSQRRSLADWLGVERTSIPAGVSIGLAPIGATVAQTVAMVGEGYRRLKVKIEPGHDIELVAAIRRELPTVELHVDANGAYAPDDVDLVVRLIERGVDAVEQPFAPSDPGAAAELIRRLAGHRPVPVVADEAVESLDDARELLFGRAMTGLSIKPARVGGLVAARALHDLCLTRGLPATAGGMLETGLGRRALAALAGLPGFSLTGDLSPAGRWLAVDPWPDLEMIDGMIVVPQGPGIAPDPDEELLARTTVEHRTVR